MASFLASQKLHFSGNIAISLTWIRWATVLAVLCLQILMEVMCRPESGHFCFPDCPHIMGICVLIMNGYHTPNYAFQLVNNPLTDLFNCPWSNMFVVLVAMKSEVPEDKLWNRSPRKALYAHQNLKYCTKCWKSVELKSLRFSIWKGIFISEWRSLCLMTWRDSTCICRPVW